MRYVRPGSLGEALELLSQSRWRVLAGATDVYPALVGKPPREDILDIGSLDALRGIAATDAGIAIGARTTWTDVLRADLPPAFDALRQAAREVGSVQIQNTATLAGNLCNASPAADGVPALMVLDAEVELAGATGRRRLPLGEFIHGNRATARRDDELLVAVHVPRAAIEGASAFLKLGARRYLVISIAMVAARLVTGAGGAIETAALSVGACSPVAMRLPALEAALRGAGPDEADRIVATHGFDELAPIDDVRATAAYRREAASELMRRAVRAALDPAIAGRAAA